MLAYLMLDSPMLAYLLGTADLIVTFCGAASILTDLCLLVLQTPLILAYLIGTEWLSE